MSKRQCRCLTVDFRREPEQWEKVKPVLEKLRKRGWNQGWVLRAAVVKYLSESAQIKEELAP